VEAAQICAAVEATPHSEALMSNTSLISFEQNSFPEIAPPNPPSGAGQRPIQGAPRRGRGPLDLALGIEKELAVLGEIRANLVLHHEALDDPDLMVMLAEGETSLLELIDAMLDADLRDEGLVSALKACKDTLAARLHRMEERRRSRRAILEKTLLLLEQKSLERPIATITLTERAPSLIVDEETQVPARFFDLKPILNRRLAREALAAGEDVPGARLSGRTLTLTVRRG
jgi:hypothetical protein